MRLLGSLFIAVLVGWLAWTGVVQEDRIVELECALAQAQALLAEESLSTGNLVLDLP